MTQITVKRSSVAGKVPATTDLALGELAVNTYDGKLYIKKNTGVEAIVEVGTNATSRLPVYQYENRNVLRSTSPTQDDQIIVEGLGLFIFQSGSDEPDDDESCFATSTGRWLIQAVHWDVVDAWMLQEADYRASFDEDESLRFDSNFVNSYSLRVLYGALNFTPGFISATTTITLTTTITGARVGDSVVVNPPTQLTSSGLYDEYLHYRAWVSSIDTITFFICNTNASGITLNSAIVTNWPIVVFRNV